MSDLSVRHIEANEYDTWDEFVAASPQGTLYHSSMWKRLIDNACAPASILLIGCFDRFNLVGGCVVMDRERFGRKTGVTPLLTPYVGFLLENPLGEKLSDQVSRDSAVLESLAGWLSRSFDYLNLVNAPHLEDLRPLQQVGFQLTPRFTYCLNLKLPAEELWERFDGSVRRQIKKAERETFTVSDLLDPETACNLFVETFRRRGEECPVEPRMFHAVLGSDFLRENRQVFSAHSGDRLISFIVLLKFQRSVYYGLAATDPEYLPTGVSPFLIWEVIKNYSNLEWNTLDFVGANIPSIARFKENFNPKLQMYFQAEYFSSAYLKLGKTLVEMLRK
jgi:hypothetical protein